MGYTGPDGGPCVVNVPGTCTLVHRETVCRQFHRCRRYSLLRGFVGDAGHGVQRRRQMRRRQTVITLARARARVILLAATHARMPSMGAATNMRHTGTDCHDCT